ncbi:MAG TPA: hypothetical protein VHG28_14475 [Longimicrobiaceae bacterium]|nr:hypothetical protein [Longimicrobiaceae bacterium]
MTRNTLLTLAAAALVAAGCEKSAVVPEDTTLSAGEAALLADEFDAMTYAVLGGALGLSPSFSAGGTEAPAAAAPVPIDVTFNRTHACPRGGSVTMSGTIKGEVDRAARSLTAETNATKTQASCAFPTRNGGTITVNGNPNIAIRSNQKIVGGAPSGPQTTTQKGGFTWKASDGRSGSCTVDITSTFDPAAKTRTVKGTICGRTVDVTRPLQR